MAYLRCQTQIQAPTPVEIQIQMAALYYAVHVHIAQI